MLPKLQNERAFFADTVSRYSAVKRHTANWLLHNHSPILSANHVSDIVATIADRDRDFIRDVSAALDDGDKDAADNTVATAIASLKAANQYVFDTPSRSDIVALYLEAQKWGVYGGQGNATDNLAHVRANADRLDLDAARKLNHDFKHRIDAAKQKKAAAS